MNFITPFFSILVVAFTTSVDTNEKFAAIHNNKYTKIHIKNQKNEVLKDSIHFSDSLISIELVKESSIKYEIQEVEIIVAEERRMLDRKLYLNVKSGDTLNIARYLQKLKDRNKKLQQQLHEITTPDISFEPKNLRIIIELKNAVEIDKVSGQKIQISEWSRGRIITLYSE
jgi:hypothetical protein